MNLFAVTPTFQSARLAGWKTGATKVNRLMALMRVQSSYETLLPTCFYTHRTLSRHRDHRHSRGNAFAGVEQGKGEGPGDLLHGQWQTIVSRLADVRM